MADSNAYTQAQVDVVVAIVGRQAARAQCIVGHLEELMDDYTIPAVARAKLRQPLQDARAIVAGAEVVPASTSMEGALRSVKQGAADRLRRSVGMPDGS